MEKYVRVTLLKLNAVLFEVQDHTQVDMKY